MSIVTLTSYNYLLIKSGIYFAYGMKSICGKKKNNNNS